VSEAVASGSTLTIKGTTLEATAQDGEPAPFKGGLGLPAGPLNSIWYRWTSTADQVVEIDTKGSIVPTVLVAYTGARLPRLRELAKGIDRVRKVTRIRFTARAGETNHLAVDGYGKKSEGYIQLNIRQPTMYPSECTMTVTYGPDVICGLDGNDVIRALGGADIIFAGNGFDLISAGGGNDIVFGEGGNDVLVGGSGNDLLAGGSLADRLSEAVVTISYSVVQEPTG